MSIVAVKSSTFHSTLAGNSSRFIPQCIHQVVIDSIMVIFAVRLKTLISKVMFVTKFTVADPRYEALLILSRRHLHASVDTLASSINRDPRLRITCRGGLGDRRHGKFRLARVGE